MADEHKPPKKDQPAWLQLYLARRASQPSLLPVAKPVGRPRRSVPMKQTSLRLTAGDRELISRWQDYLTQLTGNSIPLGETVAILARICEDRLAALGGEGQFKDLTSFAVQMIGGQEGAEKQSDNIAHS